MYESLRTRCRPASADWHYRRRVRELQLEPVLAGGFGAVFSRDRLFETWLAMKRESGPAPGIDRITFDDISNAEFGTIAGELASHIISGDYRPQRTRQVLIPKASGTGMRRLRIATICDRVVARTLADALQPHMEKLFLDSSYGFRPNRSTWHMLAALAAITANRDMWVLAVDDIRNAFDNVRISDVIAAHRALLPDIDPQLIEVMAHILRGGEPQRRVGIDQGSPLSPLALNAVLHVAHDVPMSNNTDPLWLRYADDLAYPARSVQEGRQRLKQAACILQRAHLTLKGEKGVMDLRCGQAPVLGYMLHHSDNELQIGIGEDNWKQLGQHLQDAHMAHDPNETAHLIARGWVESVAPAIRQGWTWLVRVLHVAAEQGFREILSPEDLENRRQDAYGRWSRLRLRASSGLR